VLVVEFKIHYLVEGENVLWLRKPGEWRIATNSNVFVVVVVVLLYYMFPPPPPPHTIAIDRSPEAEFCFFFFVFEKGQGGFMCNHVT
jgi:hypothetical protein